MKCLGRRSFDVILMINTQQFVDMDMDLEVLPHALAWCGGDYRGPSLLYGLIKSQPSLFDSTSRTSKVGAATKRNEMSKR